MRAGRGTALAAALGMLGFAAGAARADSLADAITLAYQSNPTLQEQRAQLRALDESYVQARSGYRPQASAQVDADYLQGAQSFFQPIKTVGASLNASQPIYSGGETSAEVRAAEAEIAAGREQLRSVEQDVVQQVIAAYVGVRRDQQALAIAQTNVDVLDHQRSETQARFDVGEVTRTDVAQAQARLSGAQAQLSSAKAQLAVSRAAYVAAVGQAPGSLDPEPPLPGLPAGADAALDAASRDNPAIVAADDAEQAAAARVMAAKAANHPTVSLRAQVGETGYYLNQSLFGVVGSGMWTQNVTAQAVFTQPLFAGGMNSSRIRQALETDNARRIAIEVAQRQSLQAAAQAWNQLEAARANSASTAEQVKADEIAFEGVRQEAGVGLRTVLDVLNAEQELRAAQLAQINARHDEYLAGAAVLVAMGRMQVGAFAPGLPTYDPQRSFDKVRHQGEVPWEGLVAGLDSLGQPEAPKPPAAMHPAAAASSEPAVPAQAGGQVLP